MTSRYIANTPAEQREMLRTVGAASIEDLLVKIPPNAVHSLKPVSNTASIRCLAFAVAVKDAPPINYSAE